MTKSVGIIGCGWLGFPLAKHLVDQGYSIHGTTTSVGKIPILAKAGISPYKVSLLENEIKGAISEFLSNSNMLIINVPPGLRGKGVKESYIKKIALLHTAIKKTAVEKVIFVSSTSVYGDISGKVTEESKPNPITESGKQLLACENLFATDPSLKTTIIRFGGLIGPDRHPVTMLSKRENLKGGNAPVNLIHLKDCINIISQILKDEEWNEIFNAVYPHHPTKKEYYTKEALKRGIKPPDYLSSDMKIDKEIHTCKYFLIKNDVFITSIYS